MHCHNCKLKYKSYTIIKINSSNLFKKRKLSNACECRLRLWLEGRSYWYLKMSQIHKIWCGTGVLAAVLLENCRCQSGQSLHQCYNHCIKLRHTLSYNNCTCAHFLQTVINWETAFSCPILHLMQIDYKFWEKMRTPWLKTLWIVLKKILSEKLYL